ncbi:hypothetical protein [Streptomyces albogriseolus]|uniref:hypothetical protein n=1 Tax=Streptomyces albogriseolus TaxID=1887 RepID=UPI003460CE89
MSEASRHVPHLRPLPARQPQAALQALTPEELPPSDVNLFGVPAGEVVDRRFDPGRLHRISHPVAGPDGPEPAA